MGRKRRISDAQLLEAARLVFVERGLSGSTREIARRAGVSEAVLFQRYATKSDLFLAAMVPPAFDLKGHVAGPTQSLSGERMLRDLLDGLVDYFRSAAPVVIQLLANQDFEFERFAQAHPDNSFASLRWALMDYLKEMKREGKLGADPSAVALILFSTAHSLVLFERLGAHGGKFPEPMIDSMVATLWAGAQPR